MRQFKFNRHVFIVVLMASAISGRVAGAGDLTVDELGRQAPFHGLAVDRADPGRIYLATELGMFLVTPDGGVGRLSEKDHNFMGFAAHPGDPVVLFASGHPPEGGNLGFVVSDDGGVSWSKLADGVDGPVDFHQMAVSAADPQVIYGVYETLQRSTDGGRTWQSVGRPPAGMAALAASSRDADTLFAATQQGLLISTDGGRRWRGVRDMPRPATMVDVSAEGVIHAFVAGIGLVRASEDDLGWEVMADDFGGAFITHLAVDPYDARRLFAITLVPGADGQSLIASGDGGASWTPLGVD